MPDTESLPLSTSVQLRRERSAFVLGADLEPMLAPVRQALKERARVLMGDLPAAAMQLLAEGHLAYARAFEPELILVALEELQRPA